jgi:ABC-type Fe3+-siderophore transport system permease subunit
MAKNIQFWLMGSLSLVTYQQLAILFPLFLVGVIPLLLLRWRLNVMSLGDEEAKSMGVNTGFIRWVSIACSTLLTAGSVAFCGVIGWVGSLCPTCPVLSSAGLSHSVTASLFTALFSCCWWMIWHARFSHSSFR